MLEDAKVTEREPNRSRSVARQVRAWGPVSATLVTLGVALVTCFQTVRTQNIASDSASDVEQIKKDSSVSVKKIEGTTSLSLKDKDIDLKFIDIAINIINDNKSQSPPELKKWAYKVLSKKSDVPIEEATLDILSKKDVYISASATRSGTTVYRVQSGFLFSAPMVVDADGSKYVKDDPLGMGMTSLRNANGKPTDSDVIPFIVLPDDQVNRITQVGEKKIARLGDFAVVSYEDKIAYAIVADIGPRGKYGEGSIALHRKLGHEVVRQGHLIMEKDADLNINRPEPLHGTVHFLVFPGSGNGQGRSVTEIESIGQQLFQQWGGVSNLKKLLSSP